MTQNEFREVRRIKNKYLPGTIVRLVYMDDKQAPEKGTQGTVTFVDDIGNIHVKWANGSSLALIEGVDDFEVLEYGDEYYDNGD